MKVIHVSRSDISGGAARAAYRIHKSLLNAGIDSRMRVLYGVSGDSCIDSGPIRGLRPIEHRLRSHVSQLAVKYFSPRIGGAYSAAWPDTGLGYELNACQADIINLHWLGTDTLSVEEIGRLAKPVVWRLADMWAFCGAEHYAADALNSRFRNGYTRKNMPVEQTWFDMNRWVWQRKKKHWRQPMHIVCTSRWLESCVKESELFRNWPVTLIPNALDVDVWHPMDRFQARQKIGLDQNAKIALFGAPSGLNDPRKGGDLALEALSRSIQGVNGPDQLVIFGQNTPDTALDYSIPVKYLGRVNDDQYLAAVYSAADVLIMPSRQESFGQVASEALACGTPVAAFNIGGLPDIVEHKHTGWLAKPFDTEDLAAGIDWILNDTQRYLAIQTAARSSAKERFSESVVADKYISLYEHVLEGSIEPA